MHHNVSDICFYVCVHDKVVLASMPSYDIIIRYKALVLILTFCCYTSYHLSRKPTSVVKVSSWGHVCECVCMLVGTSIITWQYLRRYRSQD